MKFRPARSLSNRSENDPSALTGSNARSGFAGSASSVLTSYNRFALLTDSILSTSPCFSSSGISNSNSYANKSPIWLGFMFCISVPSYSSNSLIFAFAFLIF